MVNPAGEGLFNLGHYDTDSLRRTLMISALSSQAYWTVTQNSV